MPDGYGFAAQGDKGVFGARTLSPMAFTKGIVPPTFCYSDFESFGIVSNVTGAAMFHGRTSTNTKSLINTHPISKEGWQRVATNLSGYYACGAIDPDGMLHVFRDKIAPLVYAYSETLKAAIFATTEELIEVIGDYIKEELVCFDMKDDTYLVFDGGELISQDTFKSKGWDKYSRSWADTSLGSDWNDRNYGDDWYSGNVSEPDFSEYDALDETYTYHLGLKEISYEEFVGLTFDQQIDCVITKNGRLIDLSNEFSKSA